MSTLLLSAAFLAPAAAAHAAGDVQQFEQLNRANGAQGAVGLFVYSATESSPGIVTDDGRYGTFTVRPAIGEDPLDFAFNQGLYFRDIVANRNTRITDGSGVFTGLDAKATALSFVTPRSYDRSDTNGAPDLYAYDTAGGQKVLLSRADGKSGAALGLDGAGAVAKGGKVAIFSSGGNVYRRDYAKSTTTKIASGRFLSLGDEPTDLEVSQVGNTLPDQFVSADGSVVTTSTGIVTPGGTLPLPARVQGSPGTVPDTSTEPVQPLITEDGKTAIYGPTFDALGTKFLDTASGAVTAPAISDEVRDAFSPGPARYGTVLESVAPDGTSAVVGRFDGYDAYGAVRITTLRWNFAAATVEKIHDGAVRLSRNGRFGIVDNNSGNDGGRTRAIVGIGDNQLPGTVDLPSGNDYIFFTEGCGPGVDDNAPQRHSIAIAPAFDSVLPRATSIEIRGYDSVGRAVLDEFLVNSQTNDPTDDGNPNEGQGVGVPVPDSRYSFDVIVTLNDGRQIRTHNTRPAKVFEECPAGSSNPPAPTAQ